MEDQKIINLLARTTDNVPRFNTKKLIEVHDQSGRICNANKQIRFKTSMLQSDICDYSNSCVIVRGAISVTGNNNIDRKKMCP